MNTLINNNDTLEIIIARLQKDDPRLFYVVNNEKVKVYDNNKIENLYFEARVSTQKGLDRFYFYDDQGIKYCVFGHDNMTTFIKSDDKEVYSVEVPYVDTSEGDVKGEPVIDIVSEIVDQGKNIEEIVEDKRTLPDNAKIVRIVSSNGENVVEIIVPDKPCYEMTTYYI